MKHIEEIQVTLDFFTLSTVKEIMDQKPLFEALMYIRLKKYSLLPDSRLDPAR